jgi:hypothetical protein
MTTARATRWNLGITPTMFLLGGLAMGWALAAPRSQPLQASSEGRVDDSTLATGPAFLTYNEGAKTQVAQDALYYLDYRAGKLFATIPRVKAAGSSAKFFDAFAERDLVADFKLDNTPGPQPRFMMTTGSISTGSHNRYGDGWAALYVVETTTRQIAAYKIDQTQVGAQFQLKFELLDVRPFAARGPAPH